MSKPIIDDSIFLSVTKPSRYTGGEFNSVKKEWSGEKIKFALVFPEPYEIGMSHLGYQIVYSILNSIDDVLCERVFMPWKDMYDLLDERKIPLFSLESRRPLSEFDVIGFSLQYELSFTNILSILKLAGIPYLAEERDDKAPLIIGGGPCAFNPEPLAPFFDAFLIGEGEEALADIVQVLREKRADKSGKKETLNKLSKILGIYVPSLREDRHSIIKKRSVTSLGSEHMPKAPVVPFMEIVHDRVSIEIQRGCTKGCRFCHAGMIYRPTRQRSSEEIVDYALKTQKQTGWEDISFLSLNSSDHPSLKGIFSTLSSHFKGSSVSLSLPSTRIDGFDEGIMNEILNLRKTGFTFAPEAGTERLRRAINKPITDEEILTNLERIFNGGWNTVKLYFMIGLPTETDEDISGIISLSWKILKLARDISKRNRITINISPFVPKAHTPYQWIGQEELSSLKDKIDHLKRELSHRAISLKWHDPEVSTVEAVLARGDRKVAKLLLAVHEKGGMLDAWSDFFSFNMWEEAGREAGIDIRKEASRSFGKEDPLPWEVIDTGATKEFFLSELEKTYSGETTEDCAFRACSQCGLCDDHLKPLIETSNKPPAPAGSERQSGSGLYIPMILDFEKRGRAKFLSHLEMMKVFERTFRRSGLKIKVSEGFHPIPIMKFTRALPLGIESESEKVVVNIDISQKDASRTSEAMNINLPEGIRINSVKFPSEWEIKRDLDPVSSSYEVSFGDTGPNRITGQFLEGKIAEFKGLEKLLLTKKTKKGIKEINLKDIIVQLRSTDNRAYLKFDETKQNAGPFDTINRILGLDLKPGLEISITKIKEV